MLVLQEALEIALADDDQLTWAQGDDRGGARVVVEHPHLAEQFAGTENAKDDFAPFVRRSRAP
ncbi:MAG: hypothetical protein MZW92_78685 [Comamonadaceae bacterium]|nr:hypothetical protein [Comamonadaceae bacterium]